MDRILEAVRLTASSSGLQPYEVLVVNDPALRARIRKHAWNQAQVTEASHLLVFAAWDNYGRAHQPCVRPRQRTARHPQRRLGGLPPEAAVHLPAAQRSAEENYQHAARQAYIGLGTALIAAAEEQVDATPMEGFDPAQVDEILGLNARGLRSVLLVPLGYRQVEGDWLVNLKKVRRAKDQFVTTI